MPAPVRALVLGRDDLETRVLDLLPGALDPNNKYGMCVRRYLQ